MSPEIEIYFNFESGRSCVVIGDDTFASNPVILTRMQQAAESALVLSEQMLSLVYVSSATKLLSDEELIALLEQSRRNNSALDITGMLLYKEGNFMQVLEGPDAAVRQIYLRILIDGRHHGAIKLLEGSIAERQFGNWSMGFKNLAGVKAAGVPGYTEFLDLPFVAPEFQLEPARAQKMLLMFRDKLK